MLKTVFVLVCAFTLMVAAGQVGVAVVKSGGKPVELHTVDATANFVSATVVLQSYTYTTHGISTLKNYYTVKTDGSDNRIDLGTDTYASYAYTGKADPYDLQATKPIADYTQIMGSAPIEIKPPGSASTAKFFHTLYPLGWISVKTVNKGARVTRGVVVLEFPDKIKKSVWSPSSSSSSGYATTTIATANSLLKYYPQMANNKISTSTAASVITTVGKSFSSPASVVFDIAEPTATPTPSPSCTDSDGKNANKPGVVTYINAQGVRTTYADYCLFETITEYFCKSKTMWGMYTQTPCYCAKDAATGADYCKTTATTGKVIESTGFDKLLQNILSTLGIK